MGKRYSGELSSADIFNEAPKSIQEEVTRNDMLAARGQDHLDPEKIMQAIEKRD